MSTRKMSLAEAVTTLDDLASMWERVGHGDNEVVVAMRVVLAALSPQTPPHTEGECAAPLLPPDGTAADGPRARHNAVAHAYHRRFAPAAAFDPTLESTPRLPQQDTPE